MASELPGGKPLPTGTVTFLFSDIQGSTPLWEREPEKMAEALQIHNTALRQAIEAHGGVIFKVVGDAFQAAFPTAPQAVKAAIDAQKALQSAPWNELGPLSVRMGLHTGEAQLDSGGDEYAVSHTKNRAARIMAAAHGGQTLLSAETYELCSRQLPSEVQLRGLGEHRLKGMAVLERLYQVCAPGLATDFPPLATGVTQPHNLPAQLTTFIGREQEIGEVVGLLEIHRLVTLVGSGGTGKTRLSLRVAEELLEHFPNGAWFAELAGLGDPELVPRTIAAALGLQESANRTLLSLLQDYLHEKKVLLILDNCEHVISDCARICDALLRACPNLKILGSSREALSVPGEAAYHVPSLAFPEARYLTPMKELTTLSAVQLFAERAARAHPGLTITEANAQSIAQICRRLDGIPLAIELAAARAGVLSVEQIAARLDNRFRLLTGGSRTAVPRQQTLRASIDWSYSSLDERERTMLLRLSVFYGGWTLEAASMVCGFGELDEFDVIDSLAQLANKSLIVVEGEPGGSNRYRMLETIRQYASEKLLDSGESSKARNLHLDFFTQLSEDAEPHLRGAQQVEWLDRLEIEIDNLRAALEWALEEQARKGATLASSLYWMWHIRSYRVEGERWLNQLYEKLNAEPFDTLNIPVLVKTRVRQCLLLLALGLANPRTTRIIEETKLMADQLGEGGKLSQVYLLFAQAWNANLNDLPSEAYAPTLKGLAMAKALGDRFMMAEFFMRMFNAEADLAKRLEYAMKNLALRRELGDLDGLMLAYHHLAVYHFGVGNLEQARQNLEQSLDVATRVKNRWGIFSVQFALGYVLGESSNFTESIEYLQQALSTSMDLGEMISTIWTLNALGHVEELKGDWPAAEGFFLQAIQKSRSYHSGQWEVRSCLNLAEAAWKKARFSTASQYYQAAAQAGEKADAQILSGLVAYGLGKAALLAEDTQAAYRYFCQSLEEAIQQNNPVIIEHNMEALAVLSASQPGQAARAARLGGIVESRRRVFPEWGVAMCYLASFDLDKELLPARVALGEEEFTRLYAEGQALTLEQAAVMFLAACRRDSDFLDTNCPTGPKRPLITAKEA